MITHGGGAPDRAAPTMSDPQNYTVRRIHTPLLDVYVSRQQQEKQLECVSIFV